MRCSTVGPFSSTAVTAIQAVILEADAIVKRLQTEPGIVSG
jgi:hypothetical protein